MNLFISYAYADQNQVNDFEAMLKNAQIPQLDYVSLALRENYTAEGKSEIRRQIKNNITRSDITVCLISQRTKDRDWVNWELEQSRLLDKPIVGIVLKNQPIKSLQGVPGFFTRYRQYEFEQWGSPEKLRKIIQQALW